MKDYIELFLKGVDKMEKLSNKRLLLLWFVVISCIFAWQFAPILNAISQLIQASKG